MKHAIAAALILAAACTTTTVLSEPHPPLPSLGPSLERAYELAGKTPLEPREGLELPGIHHYFALSDSVHSGAEPEGRTAFETLASLGIKTIVSVDGATPDHETASEFGLRYVHVPIRYSGMEQDQINALAKTFRELDGPFYVHCFHGKHRGPAGAAIGRLVVDGVEREVALAEMRQWIGTAEKYEGLYATVAYGAIPDEAVTAECAFDFPTVHAFGGFREAMTAIPRQFDVLVALSKRDWEADPSHPDWDGVNAATKLADVFAQTRSMQEVLDEDDEYQGWLARSEALSRKLATQLEALKAGDRGLLEPSKELVTDIRGICNRCHKGYRNDPGVNGEFRWGTAQPTAAGAQASIIVHANGR